LLAIQSVGKRRTSAVFKVSLTSSTTN